MPYLQGKQIKDRIPTSPTSTSAALTTETSGSIATRKLTSTSNPVTKQSLFTGLKTDDITLHVPVTDMRTTQGVLKSTDSALRRIGGDSNGKISNYFYY